MTDLATRIEQAGPEQQREMLKLAWQHIRGGNFSYPFAALLAIGTDEAFTGAALMLMPDRLKLRIGMGTLMGKYSAVSEIVRGNAAELLVSFVGETVAVGDAATPALAIAAACVRAHDKENG